jgi:hypothetical protein
MSKDIKTVDHLQMRVVNLETIYENIRVIQKRQTILLNILQKKLEVKDHEIIEEEKRLDAKLKAGPRNFE